MNASVAIQVLPKVATDAETIRVVDEVIAFIKSYDVKAEVGPFETTIEGDYEVLMEIVKGCPKVCVPTFRRVSSPLPSPWTSPL